MHAVNALRAILILNLVYALPVLFLVLIAFTRDEQPGKSTTVALAFGVALVGLLVLALTQIRTRPLPWVATAACLKSVEVLVDVLGGETNALGLVWTLALWAAALQALRATLFLREHPDLYLARKPRSSSPRPR